MAARRRNLDPEDIEGLEYFDTLVPFLAAAQRHWCRARQSREPAVVLRPVHQPAVAVLISIPRLPVCGVRNRHRRWRRCAAAAERFVLRLWAHLAKPHECLTPKLCMASCE